VTWRTVTPLMPHQQPAIDKLLPSRVAGLFMPMGTGKTLTAFAFVEARQERIDCCVWFCPVGYRETIRRQILLHTDCQDSDICVFGENTDEETVPRGCLWYIVGIESISAYSARVVCTARLLITERTFVVVDESGYIKGPKSRRTERLTLIARDSRYRMILTGTPISQGIVDLFSQMRFLSPLILGYRSFHAFAKNHLVYSARFPGLVEGEKNRAYVAERIAPYVYQVTKEECLTLPEKLYSARYCQLSDPQREAYAEAKERFLTDDALDRNEWYRSIAIFRLFTALQGIVCGFVNRDGRRVMLPHYRIDLLLNVLAEIPAEPVVIWAKYRPAAAEIVTALEAIHGAEAVRQYHGGLTPLRRQGELDQWCRSGGFLVATQAAGGHCVDMTVARWAIFYANDFMYSRRLQAEDRCHRIGQTRPVTYVDLWASAGIEQRIDAALVRKGNAVEAFHKEVSRFRQGGRRIQDLARSL